MGINHVTVAGNLTRDPALRQAGSTPVLEFGIAVNDRKKNNQTGEWEDVPNFFDVLVWGSRGESLSRYLKKGSKVAISGRLRWSQWQTKDGDKRSKVEIVADDVEFMRLNDYDTSERHTGPTSNAEAFGVDIPW